MIDLSSLQLRLGQGLPITGLSVSVVLYDPLVGHRNSGCLGREQRLAVKVEVSVSTEKWEEAGGTRARNGGVAQTKASSHMRGNCLQPEVIVSSPSGVFNPHVR